MFLKKINSFLIACLSISLIHCSEPLHPEKRLLNIYKAELMLLKKYSSKSYERYMLAEIDKLAHKRARMNYLITEINDEFDSMTTEEKNQYEKKWRKKYQPVIEEIFRENKILATEALTRMTPEMVSDIKRLHNKREQIERKIPDVSLKPKFYVLPEEVLPHRPLLEAPPKKDLSK